MRHKALLRHLGIVLGVAFALGVLATFVAAQEDVDLLPFPRSSAAITLTDTELTISPAQLDPGPVTFTIQNNSSRVRGVYVVGEDLVGSPIIRYSMRVRPGDSTQMEFWLYQGQTFTFRDYTARRVVAGESVFDSTYSRQVTIPVLVPIGRGPQFERKTGTIAIASTGIQVSPSETDLGPIMFTVTNETNLSRGVVLTGEDSVGNPIIRYSRLIPPGGSRELSFWLYEGKTYAVRDYTRRYIVAGDMRFDSTFSTMLSVR